MATLSLGRCHVCGGALPVLSEVLVEIAEIVEYGW
jgi:hypothetical protein